MDCELNVFMDSDRINRTAYLQRIVPSLTDWFLGNARDLPWRKDPLPYYVWVSEIMLQQTRVETVKPYFRRFIETLPDIEALSRCPEDRLMKLWEGLGYYSRVRNMQKAAKLVMEKYGGRLPEEAPELANLPGIGSYTAAAVSSIAFGRPYAAVDGNVLRVVSRICADDSCIDETKVKKMWEQVLTEVLRAQDTGRGNFPGLFNQALMELGALICLPNGEPDCTHCPEAHICRAHLSGSEIHFPVRKAKKARKIEERTVLVIRNGEDTLIRKREKKGLLAGLWELPNFDGKLSRTEAVREAEAIGLSPVRVARLPDAKYVFSHIEWHMTGYLIFAADFYREKGSDVVLTAKDGRRYLLTGPDKAGREYAIPSAFSAYMKYLSEKVL